MTMNQMDRPFSLRVVPLDNVFLHENVDPQRVQKLAKRLEVEDVLVNPPIVVEAGDSYVVLDGATRTTALKQLGYVYTVVQIVSPDEDLSLRTWYHTVRGADPVQLIKRIDDLPEIDMVEHESPKAIGAVLARKRLCYLHTIEDRIFLVRATPGVDELEALNLVTKTYIDTSHLTRTLTTNMDTLRREYPDLTALVVFPQYTVEQVLQIARNGQLMPSGITRFIIPGRVLRINVDLYYLRSDKSLDEKNEWLDQLLEDKLNRGKIRYYQEPVYLLDE
ncbi:MAG: hypothetical protein JW953_16250 [Anaerolineae bacterium]|nr:hypothetical protein [Anaerolineae bacterium]